ncbi:alpha/beta fold hydrolase [Chthonobacter albigriseus]|uniref:alpha/beta fold hydrolase n=1 Tax=Chthonobacter albigriseus TaxID=1683161 RepID=UPI0015EF0339|nr:alpha/beta fold hydrolase [Chthonobacter albigriseus]
MTAIARPIAVRDGFALLHPGRKDTAVLICAPWGFEALCVHKSYRILADRIASAGYAVLRFDYPGTGDAQGSLDDCEGVEDWLEAVDEAATVLKSASGATSLVVCGQGLGSVLARVAAARRSDVVGSILLAPPENGRRAMREIGAWAALINEIIGLPKTDRSGGLDFAGFEMPAAFAASLQALDPLAGPAPAQALVAVRPGRDGDAAVARKLSDAGASVRTIPFEGYAELATDPTSAVVPLATWDAVVEWLAETFPGDVARPEAGVGGEPRAVGPGYVETAFRFGPDDRLFAILCEPAGEASPPSGSVAAVFLNSGFDHHIGWARMAVDQSRALARAGFAAMRIDSSDIGEGLAAPGGPVPVLYSDAQLADVSAALDALADRGYPGAFLVGRCSGAFLAFGGAVADARVRGAVVVNIQRLVWDPDEDVAIAIRNTFRSLGDYRERLFTAATLKRLVTGDIDVPGVVLDIGRRIAKKVGILIAPVTGGLTKYGGLAREVRRRFKTLAARRAPISLVYSVGDGGLDELAAYYGRSGRGVGAFPNVTVSLIPNADHTITPPLARATLEAHILHFAARVNADSGPRQT